MTKKTRPSAWKYATREEKQRHLTYQRARAQAKYRKEEFLLTFEEFFQLWTDELWNQRGRSSNAMALSRKNFQGPWSLENCHVIPRREQVSEANLRRLKDKRNGKKSTGDTSTGLS